MMVCREFFEDPHDGFAMQRHHPADLQLIGGDALFRQNLPGFLDDAVGGPPADQRHIRVAQGPISSGGGTAASMPATFRWRFSIMARRLIGIGELVADQYAVLHVLIRGGGVVVAGNAGDGARRNTAFGEQ